MLQTPSITSSMVNNPSSSASCAWNITCRSRSPSSSFRLSAFPVSPRMLIPQITSAASSMHVGFKLSCVCARSQGQPSGALSCATICRRVSKFPSAVTIPVSHLSFGQYFLPLYHGGGFFWYPAARPPHLFLSLSFAAAYKEKEPSKAKKEEYLK